MQALPDGDGLGTNEHSTAQGCRMSVCIELPCGCRITKAFVIGMCYQHAEQIDAQQRVADAAYREFEQKMTSSVAEQ